jgi:RNA polymerase sigma factor (sigma-70 family)
MTGARPAADISAARARAAVDLLEHHATAVMATARWFAATPDDADDAYQRGVEIMLTKAPIRDGRPIPRDELLPWLRTVIKREAWAIARQRQRAAPLIRPDDPLDPISFEDGSVDPAERRERLRLAAEAMGALKPQEARALRLKAAGYSYRQIQERCGWTYTKVNRCLTEGRQAFAERVAAIEAGSDCERLAPVLSKLSGGEAGGAELAALRPHLRGCLVCRRALRQARAAASSGRALAGGAL